MQRETIAQIRERLSKAAPSELPSLVSRYDDDDRAGVVALLDGACKKLARAEEESERLHSLTTLQRTLHAEGYQIIAGVDEVGRGALAGPVSAGAVILPVDLVIPELDDSKKLSPEVRAQLDSSIRSAAIAVSICHIEAHRIDELGIAGATLHAMRGALDGLGDTPDHVIVDGLPLELGIPSTAVVGGDGSVSAIAAASVVAKVSRDRLMVEMDTLHPGYGFTVNKGYGTGPHLDAIRSLGVTAIHRRSFAPCVDQQALF